MPWKRRRSFFSLTCGCKGSKSVSVSVSVSDTSEKSKDPRSSAATDTRTTATATTATATTAPSPSPSPYDEDDPASITPTFSGLLHQLSELKRSVMEWAPTVGEQEARACRHRRCRSEGGEKVLESMAVVKESEDPLADFRRSMLQMIVEKEIVDGEELRQLLRRFLQLNSPRHHEVILRAFAEIWNEVFSGYEKTPDLLRRSKSSSYYRRQRQ